MRKSLLLLSVLAVQKVSAIILFVVLIYFNAPIVLIVASGMCAFLSAITFWIWLVSEQEDVGNG